MSESKFYKAVPAAEYQPKLGDVIYAITEIDGIGKIGRVRVDVVDNKKFAAFIKDKSVATIIHEVPVIEIIDKEDADWKREYENTKKGAGAALILEAVSKTIAVIRRKLTQH